MSKIVFLMGLLVVVSSLAIIFWTGIVYLFWNVLVIWAFSVAPLTWQQALVLGVAVTVFLFSPSWTEE